MRKYLLAICGAAVLATGCTGPGSTGAQGGMGWASTGSPPGVQQASWTQKLMAPFAATPAAVGGNRPSAEEVSRRQALDPISLGFNSGSDSPQLYVSMAEMAHRGGNVAQARQLYQKALTADPKFVPALLSAARMEDREGQMDVALGLYQNAAAVEPNNPTVLNDLALCLARKGDFAEAHRALAHVVQLEPRKPLYRNNMAKVLIEMNRLDEAAWHLGHVHQPAVVNYNMGVLLQQRGRTQEASQFLAQAIQIDPQMHPARILLAQITAPAATAVATQPSQQPVIHTAQAPQSQTAQPAPTPNYPQTATPASNTVAPQAPVLTAPTTVPAAPATTQAPVQQIAPAVAPPSTVGGAASASSQSLAQSPSRLPEVN